MVVAAHVIALVLYAATAAVYGASLAGGRSAAPRGGVSLLVVAVLTHMVALALFTTTFGELPLVGLPASLSTFAFLVGALMVVWTGLRETRPLGLVLAPLNVVLLSIALLQGLEPTGQALRFRGLWLFFHVTLSFLGAAGLAFAFASGLLYLLQFRELKDKRFGRMFRFFPPLETLDRMGRTGVMVGFTSLTIGLVVGWGWTLRFEQAMGVLDGKVLWGTFTWLVLIVALLARLRGAERDRRGALASVVGFVLVVVAYVVIRFTLAHGRLFL